MKRMSAATKYRGSGWIWTTIGMSVSPVFLLLSLPLLVVVMTGHHCCVMAFTTPRFLSSSRISSFSSWVNPSRGTVFVPHASTIEDSGTITDSKINTTNSSAADRNNGSKTSRDRNNNKINFNKVESPQSPSMKAFRERITNSGVASAAAMATAAVNAAVAMKTLEAPDVQKSYIALDRDSTTTTSTQTTVAVDEEGLPLVYNKDLIEAYWTKERGALNQRWGQFVGKAVPFLTRIVTLLIRDGKVREEDIPALSRQARLDLQDLGPTFIKAGQMMSVRPDVLPQSTLEELQKLQDSVVPFDTATAVAQIERELGGPLGQFFTSISEEPVAAASLAQVYLATLADGNNTRVAIKVQRPNVLGTVSKDLYVLRRAAEVFSGLVQRFAPQQKTDYVALLNEWAIGFYTELDFKNEAANQRRLRQMMLEKNVRGVIVPKVFDELCTRRILVSQWVDGKKLSKASPEEIAAITPIAQEAFLTQLFEVGFFHADPHPGNLLLLDQPTSCGAKLALIDCGLMASIDEIDRDNMISAVIHLANKDYAALVDDFIKLGILPKETNRAAVIPLMDKALSPYVMGGGAKKYEEELRKIYGMEDGSMQSQVGGFQAMTQDALTVLEKIPFSIPPYFAILGRAIVTLEGIALTGNEKYGIIMESYPFIARKLLREGRPEIQKALQEVLYSKNGDNKKIKVTRLLALLNNAAGSVATQAGAAFVDLDAVPKDGISMTAAMKFLLSENASSLRVLLEKEMDDVVDVLSRRIVRRAVTEAVVAFTPPQPPVLPFLGSVFPAPPALDSIRLPYLIPRISPEGKLQTPSLLFLTLRDLMDAATPGLSQDEELFAISLTDAASQFLGNHVGELLRGRNVLSTETVSLILAALQSGVLARNDLMSTNAARAAVEFFMSGLKMTRHESNRLDSDLAAAIESLDPDEKTRLDDIIATLAQRMVYRTVERLSTLERFSYARAL